MKRFGNLYFTKDGGVFLKNGEPYPFDERRYRKDGTYEGYRNVLVHGKKMLVHRIIAKLFVPNPKPDEFNIVDHISRVRSDNSSANLRWVNRFLNAQNVDKVGDTVFDHDVKMWHSSITVGDEEYIVGWFRTFLEGHLATRQARITLFDKLYKDELAKTSHRDILA